jgi:hypothetical protein
MITMVRSEEFTMRLRLGCDQCGHLIDKPEMAGVASAHPGPNLGDQAPSVVLCKTNACLDNYLTTHHEAGWEELTTAFVHLLANLDLDAKDLDKAARTAVCLDHLLDPESITTTPWSEGHNA